MSRDVWLLLQYMADVRLLALDSYTLHAGNTLQFAYVFTMVQVAQSTESQK